MFYGFVITEAGNRLLARMVAGESLVLSRVVMEKGTAESAEVARGLSAPLEAGPEGTSTTPTVENHTVHMIVEYRSDLNGGLTTGFWIGGFAVYAKDPCGGADILVYYGSLGDAKQYVSAYVPGAAPDVRRYPVSITLTEGVEVTVSYPTEAWMTATDVAAFFHEDLKPELLKEVKEQVARETAGLSNLISISDTEPDSGPCLWFDTRGVAPETEVAMLHLGLSGEEALVQLDVDNTPYPVTNAALGDSPTGDHYSLEIL